MNKYNKLRQSVVGKKVCMTTILDDHKQIPVTIIECPKTYVLDYDSNTMQYFCVAFGFGLRIKKSDYGILKKHGFNMEIRKASTGTIRYVVNNKHRTCYFFSSRGEGLKSVEESGHTAISFDNFNIGDITDIRGKTKGKGFAGVMKRHNFSGNNASHGASLSHRSAGGISGCQDPGRVMKGKKMAGHMGNEFRTSQNLKVLRSKVIGECLYLYIKGSIPGPNKSVVRVRHAIKKSRNQEPWRNNG